MLAILRRLYPVDILAFLWLIFMMACLLYSGSPHPVTYDLGFFVWQFIGAVINACVGVRFMVLAYRGKFQNLPEGRSVPINGSLD